MTNTRDRAQILRLHPSSRCNVATIEARFELNKANQLHLAYRLSADLHSLRVPSPTSLRRAKGLWEHTCFEAFIGTAGKPAYYEYNFSPSSEWAAFSFRAYRDGEPLIDEDLAPEIGTRCESDSMELTATVRLDRLPLIQRGARLRLGLAAVVEEIDGRLSYWALKHPSEKPDFHHPDSFLLDLALPG